MGEEKGATSKNRQEEFHSQKAGEALHRFYVILIFSPRHFCDKLAATFTRVSKLKYY